MKKSILKEKIQKFISRHQNNNCQEKSLGYKDLTPESDTKNSGEYIRALHWAIKNKEVKNIALSGPYGSGKSSVIKTYLEKYPRTKYLSISLAAFSTSTKNKRNDENNGTPDASPITEDWILDDVDENIIEEGILKQLFYKVGVGKIPQSRYRKIKKLSYWKIFFALLIVAALISIVYLEIHPNTWQEFIQNVVNNGAIFHLNKFLSFTVLAVTIIVLFLITASVLKYIMSNFRISNINLGDKANISKKEERESIFDKSLDEIVYFFESTSYDTVFIEDLDRFNQPNIFIKLRELNTIINNYDNIKRKIVFIYAVKDDMFKDEERTKFFDFIVPVIPYINATNSGEILRELLDFKTGKDGVYKSQKYDISDRYIGMISPFVQDMRLLTCICNEFLVYKRTLKMTELKDEEMFSMIVYKNLYPKEFAELEAEKGIVKKAFEEKDNFVKTEKANIEEEIKPLREILENIHNDILFDLREIKHAFLGYLSYDNETYYPMKKLKINNESSYSYEQIIKNDFDLTKFKNINRIDIGYNNYSEQWHTVSNLQEKMENGGKRYLRRMNDLEFNEEAKKEELLGRIKRLEDKLVTLEGYSLRELIDEFGEEVLPLEIRTCGFLKFLLTNGYINESYADYINYFHPNSITKDENDFLRSIRMHNKAKNFSFEIKNPQQVYDRIYDVEYRQVETLNFILTDFMLKSSANDDKKMNYFYGFELAKSNVHYQFIKEYIGRGQYVNEFIRELCKYNRHLWKHISEDVSLQIEIKYQYLSLILSNASIEHIVKIDEIDHSDCIKNFIVNDDNSLANLNEVSSDILIELIEKQSIIFTKINIAGVDDKVLDYIYQNDMFELNVSMISSEVDFYHTDLKRKLNNAHYSTILETDIVTLKNRIWEHFEEYVIQFVLGIDDNNHEDITAVEDIIERIANSNIELVLKVLDKEKVCWDNLEQCCDKNVEEETKNKIWNYLLKEKRVTSTWNNFAVYYDIFGLTTELANWLNETCNAIVASELIDMIDNECIKNIIVNPEITIETVEQIVDNCHCAEEINFDISKLTTEKTNLLIGKQYIRYSVAMTEKIKKNAKASFLVYCEENMDSFIKDLSSITLSEDEVISLLEDRIIDKKYKTKILETVSASRMTQELSKAIANNNFEASKEYIKNAWNYLDVRGKYMLLINHLMVYSIAEISNLLLSLGDEWSKLSDNKHRHKEAISIDEHGYNEKLLAQLQRKGYITSYTKKDEVKKSFFEVRVKQQ